MLQITGDPNVPAGKLTFVVWAQAPFLGPYDGTEEAELPGGQTVETNRPIGAALNV